MKVVHVVESMRRGGAESVVIEHVRLAAADIEVVVVALNFGGPALEAAQAAGARVHLLGKGAARLGGVRHLASILRAERPDVVNGHNATGGLYAVAAAALAAVPVVFRTEHTIHFDGRHSVIYPWLEPLSTARSRRVVCVCEAVRDSHVRRMRWATDRFVTVNNGIATLDPARPASEVRRALGLLAEHVVLLSVGSLTVQKAQDVLLDAFAAVAGRHPDARLLLAGEGPLRAALEQRITERGLSNAVRLLGDRADVADLMAASDGFVLSSRREGLPMTLIEAMRAGRATVSTRIGGTADAVVDGETGWLVPVGDASALAEALECLLVDSARRERFGAAGRQRFLARFTAERMVRETESLYRVETALAGTAGRAA